MSKIKVKVQRFDPSKDKKPYFEEYNVPFKPKMRVLDALKYIQDNINGTLAFRWNCSSANCGSCAVEVNGVPVLACKTELKKGLRKVRIAPLRVFPIIKDLAVDYSKVYEDEKGLKPYFEKEDKNKTFLIMYDEEVQDAIKFRSCIECFICNDSCRTVRDKNLEFLGPKSIVKAMAYDKHPKDKLNRYSLLEKKGLWYCNITRCCQLNCPQNIPITYEGIIQTMEKRQKRKKQY